MSAHESSSDESDDASASPARSDAGSPRRRRAGSGASNPGSSSRAARGLAFLRRDLARSVSRSATVDSIRPDAGDARACAASSRGTDALPSTQFSRLPSTVAAAVSVASASATRRRSTPAPASYGEKLERGLRDAKRRVASASARRKREARGRDPELHDERTGERLPTRCDYQEAQALGLTEKLKTANECSRRLGLATRYRAVVGENRGVHVEARARLEKDDDDENNENARGEKKKPQKPTGTSVTFARIESVPTRLLSVKTFLNSEARLWAQARYLETDARRAAHPSKRATRPVTEIEKAIAPPEW